MKNLFKAGDQKQHEYTVAENDVASFQGNVVHPVCSTYTLAREMEWAGRLFVLDMIEDHEEGVGTHVHLDHKSPAAVGIKLIFDAVFKKLDTRGNVLCEVTVRTEAGRVIAKGTTGQRILPKTVIRDILGI